MAFLLHIRARSHGIQYRRNKPPRDLSFLSIDKRNSARPEMKPLEKVTSRHGTRVVQVNIPVDWEQTGGLVKGFRDEETKRANHREEKR